MINKNLCFKIKISRKDRIKRLKLQVKVSLELAYLCGILVGDGSIYRRKKKHDYIIKCVGNPKDEKELYYKIIGPYFNKVFGFMPKIKHQDSNTTFGFVVYSKSIFAYLTKIIGLSKGKKDQQLRIPSILKEDKSLLIHFIRGLFDTDGCISFKKRYKTKPYYPVISLSSKSKRLITETAEILKEWGFNVVETYDYKIIDKRTNSGFTIINRVELNGEKNLRKWISTINFYSPKHLKKIKKYWKGNSGKRI